MRRLRSAALLLAGMVLTGASVGTVQAQTRDADYWKQRFGTGEKTLGAQALASVPDTKIYRAFLPESVDLSDRMPPVGNQGQQSSCTAWATGYAARSYYNKASDGLRLSTPANLVSAAYVYDTIRDAGCDEGTYISDALELMKRGLVSAETYPYDEERCTRPSATVTHQANQFKIADFLEVSVDNRDQVKGELAKGHPVIFGAKLEQAFFEMGNKPGSVWRARVPADQIEGGHAMTFVGYDDRRKTFKFINSWGDDWSSAGYGYMSYDTFDSHVKYAFRIVPFEDPAPPAPVVAPGPNPQPGPRPGPKPQPVADLPVFECSRLSIEDEAVVGFVSTQADLDALGDEVGGYRVDVRLRPWPQCEALMILEGSGAGDEVPRITVEKNRYLEGEVLPVQVTTPDVPSYLHLAYFQADGSVVNLRQSAGASLRTLQPGTLVRMGDGKNGRQTFRVGGPFGPEMLLAITTRSPLFEKKRPVVETEREFLTALREATIDLEKAGRARYFAAADMPIETSGTANRKWLPEAYRK